MGGRGPGPGVGLCGKISGVGAEPTLVLVTGPPGTGKSTLAEAAAGRLDATDPLADNVARLDDLLPTRARTPPSPRRSVSP